MTVNPTSGEVISAGKSPRFSLWMGFFAFATITMGSAVSVRNSQQSKADGKNMNAEWAVFCSAFSFTITGIVTLMHLSPMFSGYIIGTKLEGIITILLAAFWAATVSVGKL